MLRSAHPLHLWHVEFQVYQSDCQSGRESGCQAEAGQEAGRQAVVPVL